ncbi:hypothetical protein FACS1894187_15100 [Synergistales bacterium]|nr:hypothetical protein FACS1894187_15100 [Synergistales bacterium]
MSIQEELRSRNPFASTAASNPWDNAYPTVSSLNNEIRDRIVDLVQNKAQQPCAPMAGLVLGDAGAGKTHMLKRILSQIQENQLPTVFVCVRAFTMGEKVYRDLWQGMFISMSRSCGRNEKHTRFNVMASQLMNDCRRQAAIAGKSNPEVSESVRYLQSELPGFHGDFARALLAYCDPNSEKKRQMALGWLQGEADEDSGRMLGVKDRSVMSESDLEREAQRLILSLGLVLARCKTSMLLCFDQLDGMRGSDLINAWGDAVAFLVNDVSCVLPMAFVRADTWYELFGKTLDNAVVERFVNKFPLKNCTLEQAEELIRVRAGAFFPSGAEEKSDWILDRLRGKLKNGSSPRVVLDLANRVVVWGEEKGASSLFDCFDRTLRDERGKLTDDLASYPPNSEHLLRALEIYLQSVQNFENVERQDTGKKYIFLTGRANNLEHAFIINTEKNAAATSAALKRGVRFLEENPFGTCRYITDKRCGFKEREQWPSVYKEMDKFMSLSGKALLLDERRLVIWYALASLRSRTENGDITYLSGDGERAADLKDLALYLKQGFKDDILEDIYLEDI